MNMQKIPAAPAGYKTVNPFIMASGAREIVEFLVAVFGAVESPEALTYDTDGLVLHSEVVIGDSVIQIADRKPDWPLMPSMLQVYVDDVVATLAAATGLGATIVTEPTEFIGVKFARIVDRWQNLWWVWEYMGEVEWGTEANEDGAEATWDESTEEASAVWKPSSEAIYIHDTLVETMRNLGKNLV